MLLMVVRLAGICPGLMGAMPLHHFHHGPAAGALTAHSMLARPIGALLLMLLIRQGWRSSGRCLLMLLMSRRSGLRERGA